MTVTRRVGRIGTVIRRVFVLLSAFTKGPDPLTLVRNDGLLREPTRGLRQLNVQNPIARKT